MSSGNGVMTGANVVDALSKQYECRVKLLAEILKLYVGFLLAFAIALFACLGALPELSKLEETDLTAEVLKGALLLSPFFILAWIAGFLFLRWNYDVVIREMDCIALTLAGKMRLPDKLLQHEHFLEAYADPKRFLPGYAIIALPILLAFGLLGWRMGTAIAAGEFTGVPSERLGLAYQWILVAGLVTCGILDGLYRRRIKERVAAIVRDVGLVQADSTEEGGAGSGPDAAEPPRPAASP